MKYYGSPRWSAEVADCSMPMTFDTYSNCSFGCIYCFSQNQRGIGNSTRKQRYYSHEVYPVDVERVKKMFLEPDKYARHFATYIKQRRVMQWGGLSDQFDGYERRFGKTLELLRFFKEINYPLCFSTKSVWWTKDERYMELVRGQKNWNFKFSIITLDERKASIIERNVPSPKERLDAIGRIAEADAGGATLRLRPFIIGVSSPSYLELIQRARDKGATALSTEFFCAELRSPSLRSHQATFRELCGFDLLEFYKKYSVSQGYLRLNRNVKRPFIMKMKELCDKIGMRFYVSDAHFKELCCNGSCCGLPASWNYSRGQFCEALQIARSQGIVHWSDISKDMAFLSGVPGKTIQNINGSSENRAKFTGMSLFDYLHYLWNTPKAGQSPYTMFEGVLIPDGVDDMGDVVYRYNPEATKGIK